MLNAHPRLRVPRESYFLLDVMEAFPHDPVLQPRDKERLCRMIVGNAMWGQWGVDSAAVLRLARETPPMRTSEFVAKIYLDLNNPAGRPRWGDKTPIYVRHMRQLATYFPDAQFIHIIRDGRDVCISLRQRGWWGAHILKWAYYWQKTVIIGQNEGKQLSPSRYYEVRYERLVEDPESTLRSVCTFLGEEFEAEMLTFWEHAEDEIPDNYKKEVHRKTFRPPLPGDLQRWRREMRVLDLALVEALAGHTLREFGYELGLPRLRPLTTLLTMLRRTAGPIVLPIRSRLVTIFPKLKDYA